MGGMRPTGGAPCFHLILAATIRLIGIAWGRRAQMKCAASLEDNHRIYQKSLLFADIPCSIRAGNIFTSY
jgi:hypothetical protein